MVDIIITLCIACSVLILLFTTNSIAIAAGGGVCLLLLSFFYIQNPSSFFPALRRRVYAYLMTDRRYVVFVAVMIIYIILSPLIGVNASLIVAYIIGAYFLHYDERSSFMVSLVFLTLCPILLIVKQDAIAEEMAVRAYYFLWIGVGWSILQSTRNSGTMN